MKYLVLLLLICGVPGMAFAAPADAASAAYGEWRQACAVPNAAYMKVFAPLARDAAGEEKFLAVSFAQSLGLSDAELADHARAAAMAPRNPQQDFSLCLMQTRQRQIETALRQALAADWRARWIEQKASEQGPAHNPRRDASNCLKLHWQDRNHAHLRNNCGFPVEAAWCLRGGGCEKQQGHMGTLRPAMRWPLFGANARHSQVWFAGCRGENSLKLGPRAESFRCG